MGLDTWLEKDIRAFLDAETKVEAGPVVTRLEDAESLAYSHDWKREIGDRLKHGDSAGAKQLFAQLKLKYLGTPKDHDQERMNLYAIMQECYILIANQVLDEWHTRQVLHRMERDPENIFDSSVRPVDLSGEPVRVHEALGDTPQITKSMIEHVPTFQQLKEAELGAAPDDSFSFEPRALIEAAQVAERFMRGASGMAAAPAPIVVQAPAPQSVVVQAPPQQVIVQAPAPQQVIVQAPPQQDPVQPLPQPRSARPAADMTPSAQQAPFVVPSITVRAIIEQPAPGTAVTPPPPAPTAAPPRIASPSVTTPSVAPPSRPVVETTQPPERPSPPTDDTFDLDDAAHRLIDAMSLAPTQPAAARALLTPLLGADVPDEVSERARPLAMTLDRIIARDRETPRPVPQAPPRPAPVASPAPSPAPSSVATPAPVASPAPAPTGTGAALDRIARARDDGLAYDVAKAGIETELARATSAAHAGDERARDAALNRARTLVDGIAGTRPSVAVVLRDRIERSRRVLTLGPVRHAPETPVPITDTSAAARDAPRPPVTVADAKRIIREATGIALRDRAEAARTVQPLLAPDVPIAIRSLAQLFIDALRTSRTQDTVTDPVPLAPLLTPDEARSLAIGAVHAASAALAAHDDGAFAHAVHTLTEAARSLPVKERDRVTATIRALRARTRTRRTHAA
jgi:hypothetical protein